MNNINMNAMSEVRSVKDGEILKVKLVNIDKHIQNYENEIAWQTWILTFKPLESNILPFKVLLYLDATDDFDTIGKTFVTWLNRIRDFAEHKYHIASCGIDSIMDSEFKVLVNVENVKGVPKVYCNLLGIYSIPRLEEIDQEVMMMIKQRRNDQ